MLTFGFDKKMTHLGALASQRRGGYCWLNYNQIIHYGAILANFLAIKTRTRSFVSGINLISIFAPNASAILVRKDKLGAPVPFSNLAMEGCREPTISAS